MAIEELYERERGPLTSRLARMLGSHAAAEDVAQEAFLRTWQRAPAHLGAGERAAWLNRTATNLAIDELRRRRFVSARGLDGLELGAGEEQSGEVLVAREALAALSPHDRMVLLLRFELGLSHAEIGALLDVSAEAARKRCARARRGFAAALRTSRAARKPVIVLQARDDLDRYRGWLERAGAEVRATYRDGSSAAIERQLASADAFVLAGRVIDLDPALYGERPRARLNDPDLAADRRELRVLRAALGLDIPVVGLCRGHQLLSVALGGSLFQDLQQDRAARQSHWREVHPLTTRGGSFTRRLLGRRPGVLSEHHQGIHRLGRRLRVCSTSDDGVVESVELPGRVLRLGLQWHPDAEESGEAGRRVAAALIEAASR